MRPELAVGTAVVSFGNEKAYKVRGCVLSAIVMGLSAKANNLVVSSYRFEYSLGSAYTAKVPFGRLLN